VLALARSHSSPPKLRSGTAGFEGVGMGYWGEGIYSYSNRLWNLDLEECREPPVRCRAETAKMWLMADFRYHRTYVVARYRNISQCRIVQL